MGTNEAVEKLEAMRKKMNKMGCSILLLFIAFLPVAGIGSLLAGNIGGIIGSVAVLVTIVVVCTRNGKINEEYKKLYKEKFVYSILEEQFDNVIYKYKEGLSKEAVSQFGLVRMGNRYSAEDYLKASYKGIGFEQSEVTIEDKGQNDDTATTYFRGRMIAFDISIKSVKSVQVFTDTFTHRGKPNIGYDMKHVEMESTDFNKKFDVLAADPVEAYYVLTPQFMERVDFLKEKFKHVGINFQGNKLYVCIWTAGDAFDGDVSREVNFLDEKATIMADVRVITDIIDVLGMMRKEKE
ncbi:MAG: DUF3137 domain-containing protein [Lachnospiraceae bacterium]|nr:DUF3137 domain-containing protein [Lachnospiraceae bacterium]